MLINRIFYTLKPLIPRSIQILIRRQVICQQRRLYSHIWPIDERAGEPPNGWPGWPDQKKFALVLCHDVDTATGQKKCHKLIKLEMRLGFRSSFNFVPERYDVSGELRHYLTENGFEVAVHGLKHDGKLYSSRKIFEQRAIRINHYLREWKSVGFHSPSMHFNLDWIHNLNIEYDQSTFDTDPFEPQREGVVSIFPFLVQNKSAKKEYVELPYTLPQDFTLFILMKEESTKIWKEKLDWVADKGGMALLNSHPDYMSFDGKSLPKLEYPVEYYVEFLEYVRSQYSGLYYHALPREIGQFWRNRYSRRGKS